MFGRKRGPVGGSISPSGGQAGDQADWSTVNVLESGELRIVVQRRQWIRTKPRRY